MKRLSGLFCAFMTAVILFAAAVPCYAASGGFEFLTYPEEALTEFRPEMLSRISSGDDHISNRGYDETGLYLSPYWTMTVNGSSVPVYATPVYDWVLDRGVIQSFQVLFTDGGTELDIEMDFSGGKVENAVVLPEKSGGTARAEGSRVVARITTAGTYTYLINGESQEYAVTLFVKENTDEDAEIAALTEQYGADNVTVYEKGFYTADEIPTDTDCIYFRRGSFVSFNHKNDIRSDEDARNHPAPAVLSLYGRENAVVTGCGTFDFTKLDRGERNLINMDHCKSTVLEGLTLLDPNGWTVTAYACEDCTIRDITVFGYRTNSDGVNICGCNDMTVADSFCRNGDDCFSVKATNTEYECHDIVFTNCVGWSNKARCFGVTGEVERDIYNITFTDCAVIYRNATWDMNRTGSLVIAAETGSGSVYNVLFENIEIHKDTGRPIYCMVYGDDINGCGISGVTFRNIDIHADGKIKISSQRELSFFGKLCAMLNNTPLGKLKIFSGFFGRFYNADNHVSVRFDNVTLNGKVLKTALPRDTEVFGNAEIVFSDKYC